MISGNGLDFVGLIGVGVAGFGGFNARKEVDLRREGQEWLSRGIRRGWGASHQAVESASCWWDNWLAGQIRDGAIET
jgi:hypothetical protein